MSIGDKIGAIKLPFGAKPKPEHDEKLVQLSRTARSEEGARRTAR